MTKSNFLFIGDPNLGPRGAECVRRSFPDATVRIWTRGDAAAEREIRQCIRSRRWDAAVSFYSDFIFHEPDLEAVALPLNIHPALPCVPGLGYDILPLLENHDRHGATLHHMEREVDTGEIFDVLSRPLPANVERAELRRRNQQAALDLLEKWIPPLAAARCPKEILHLLRAEKPAGAVWSGRRLSRREWRELSESPSLPEHA